MIFKYRILSVFVLAVFSTISLISQDFDNRYELTEYGARKNVLLEKIVDNGDTIFLDYLRPLYVFPKMKFKSKEQERFYWRTVRDVKIALPYAKLASSEITKLNAELFKLSTDQERKKYIRDFQKRIFREHEKKLRQLTVNQGKMIIRLIDREQDMNLYEMIDAYKGKFSAIFWSTIARFFGADLKVEYDGTDKDKIIERIIILVDNGQL